MAAKLPKRVSSGRNSLGQLTLYTLCLLWKICYVFCAEGEQSETAINWSTTQPATPQETTPEVITTHADTPEVTSANQQADVKTTQQEATTGRQTKATTSESVSVVFATSTLGASTEQFDKEPWVDDEGIPIYYILLPCVLLGIPLFITILCVIRCFCCQSDQPPNKKPQNFGRKGGPPYPPAKKPWKKDFGPRSGSGAVNRVSPTGGKGGSSGAY